MAEVKGTLEAFNLYDSAIIRHGFTDYMRDYEVVIYFPPDLGDAVRKFQFVGCAEAQYMTALRHFAVSLPDENVTVNLSDPPEDFPTGFIWAVRDATLVPGFSYIEDGEQAAFWSNKLGRKMHEVLFETNVYNLRLVFADVRTTVIEDFQPENDYPLPLRDSG